MNDFVAFGNTILRRDSIESIHPIVVGRQMAITVKMKSGNSHITEYYVGRDRFTTEFEFNRAWRDIEEMLGQTLPRSENATGQYAIRRQFRAAFMFLIYGLRLVISPAVQIAKLLKP